MSWAKLDDRFHAHPKVLATSLEALGLFAVGLTYSAAYETDGHLPTALVSSLARGRIDLAHELCRTGLWHVTESGFRIHDFLTYNPSKAALEKERKAARKRMKRLRSGSPNVRANFAGTPGRDGTGVLVLSSEGNKESVRGKRERRAPEVSWPEDFTLTAERSAFAERYDLKAVWEWNKFKTHALRDDKRYASWPRAWEYWCRNAADINDRRRPHGA